MKRNNQENVQQSKRIKHQENINSVTDWLNGQFSDFYYTWLSSDSDREYAFFNAANNGDLKTLNILLQIPKVRDNAADNDNCALRWAAQNGHVEVVICLLQIPSVRDNAAALDNEALRLAAENDHFEVVNSLLEIPSVRDNAAAKNNYALRRAAKEGYKVANCLLEIPSVRDNAAAYYNLALRRAAQYGHLEVVNRLLEIASVRDNVAANGNEALRGAAENHHFEVAATLVNYGADIRVLLNKVYEAQVQGYRLVKTLINSEGAPELKESGEAQDDGLEAARNILLNLCHRGGQLPVEQILSYLPMMGLARREDARSTVSSYIDVAKAYKSDHMEVDQTANLYTG